MKILAVIPARLASTRFPRKVLLPIHGLPMVEHVRRRAMLCNAISSVYVATCDEEVADVVRGYGGNVVMTADTHLNGTTRVAEAVESLDCSHVMLLQGDEPLLLPRHLDQLAQSIAASPKAEAWNAIGAIEYPDELDRHSFVKCAISQSGRIIYCFRRSPCYSDFDTQQLFVRKLLGIMAFKKEFLLRLTGLPSSPIERAESIEQLRMIEHGFDLQSVQVSPSLPSINEPHEVEAVLNAIRQDSEQSTLLGQTLAWSIR